MTSSVLLAVHVTCGVVGLVLGPFAMWASRRPAAHRPLGTAYQAVVLGLTVTAVGLAVQAPARLWWLGLVAVATEVAALAGWRERRRAAPGWLPRHVRLMCGSYLSFVTAALVVNWPSPLAWVLPTLIGTPLIEVAVQRATGRRPQPVSA